MNSDNDLNYLVTIDSPAVQKFIQKENQLTKDRLESDPRFPDTQSKIFNILTAKDKLPLIFVLKNSVYNFWQDDTHSRGILRTTSVANFNSGSPQWSTILDIDQLSKDENENWVLKKFVCFPPEFSKCFVSLSRGGKDASIIREFDLVKKQFIKDGFFIPESKSHLEWVDENTALWDDASDQKNVTNSGYARTVRLLKRDTELSQAPVLFEVPQTSMAAGASVTYAEGKKIIFFVHQIGFYEQEVFYVPNLTFEKKVKLPIPNDANQITVYKDLLLFSNRSLFKAQGKTYPIGSLISFRLDQIETAAPDYQAVFTPTQTQFLENVYVSKNSLWIEKLDDVTKSVYRYELNSGKWHAHKIKLGKNGSAGLAVAGLNSYLTDLSFNEHIYFSYSDFLTPTEYAYQQDLATKPPKIILKSPKRYDSNNMVTHQYKVQSKDGTMIPYFVVSAKNIKNNGENPTLLYGYGGFEHALTPGYLASTGKIWLENGGVYVLANIRGGGEYGPKWHSAGLRENRQKVFDDFAAIAEDLIRKKITSAKHLGIKGGSNGGLLTSVSFTQRPDLFGAVISAVPLANMMEYHKWLAGASWMAEYGNPDDPKDREFILKYSPLQNLKKDAQYPEVFYITSTKDDRVHPAHARQMVARLRELGHPVMYYENTNGGHATSTNMKDYAYLLALEFTYLFQKLF